MVSSYTYIKNLAVFAAKFSEYDHFLKTKHFRVRFRYKTTKMVCWTCSKLTLKGHMYLNIPAAEVKLRVCLSICGLVVDTSH